MDKNPDMTFIREMESRDYLSVAKIWCEVFDPGKVTEESAVKACEKMEGDSRYHTLVAVINEKVVGFVTIVESLGINMPNGYIKVNDLAVLPEFQHCGIGKMLMGRVEKLASERKISHIGLASGFQRTGAHEFYEHLGYHKSSFYFSKRLQGMD